MGDERDRVIKDIRACLVSTKQMLSLRQLENDYLTMIGERLPYRKLGFNNLQDLIISEPSLIIKTKNNEIFVDAQRSEKSSHISDLVQKQKGPKKKVIFRLKRNTTHYSPPPRMTQTTRWRPKYVVHDTRKYQRSNRPAAVSHSQFVNKASVPSKVVIPENSSYVKPNVQTQIRDTKHQVSSRLNINGLSAVKAPRDIHSSHIGSIDNSSRDEPAPNGPCTSLINSKKRITTKMSQMNLERDSGNSSPTDLATTFEGLSYAVIPKMPEPTGDSKRDLENLVQFYKLEKPIYEIKKIKTKRNNFCSCVLKVGKHSYHSYPKEFNIAEAEKYCADLALQNLPTLYNKKPSLLLTNDKEVLERITPMLVRHYHGIWDWQLKLDYTDKYNEELPNDWLKIIDKSSCIQLEKCSDHYVVRHCKPGDKGVMRNTMMVLSDVSVPSNTVQFGDDGKLSAEITCIMSANEIWCRQHSTEETIMYLDMMTRMELYYQRYGKEIKAETVTMGAYYVTNYDEAWYRVRAVQVDESEVHCFFIDYGDELSVSKTDLYQLKREFAAAQAQAFVCRLVGLEDLYEISQNSEELQKILFSCVLLELDTEAKNIDGDLTLPVYMYDVETGESINEKLIQHLSMESANPEFSKDVITEVYVSNIESNGDVYVQLHSTGYEKLQALLEKLEADVLSNPPTDLIVPVKKEDSLGKLYFAKYESNGHWYRIQIIDWSPCETLAQIYFVDYGNTDIIEVNKDIVYPLESLSDVLNLYPHQAVKVKMVINEIPEDFEELAKKAIPEDEPVLLKVIGYNDHLIPQVEFFKRNLDGGLFCINKSISIESEIRKGNNNNKKRNRLSIESKNVPSSGKLQSPTLPSKGDYFEVHVPFAVNPYNFFVQPLKTRHELNEMMEQLQERYKDIVHSPLTADQVVHGNIYASKHEDGNWYRTSVIKVIHPGSISVFYCDFGYYANLTVHELIPLDIEFMQLPYQSMKAKLANIRPKQSQWTMNDCDNFREMVEGKNFYSILLEIERDELYEEDLVLSLILIDTSSPDDVLIGDELIKKDVAVAAKK